jgi:hypothetical protein
MNESDIKHEAGRFWVLDHKTGYSVMMAGLTHSTADSTFKRTADGLSLAIARANYLNQRKTGGTK